MIRSRPAARRCAFSLLEVILAIALSAIVVYLITGAVEFHLRQLTVRKTSIEEAQLARAILRRIADDLRAVVLDRPIDFSSVNQLLQSTPNADNEESGEESDGGRSSADEIVDSSLLPTMPGIYGNAYELQVDISRIPRYEEYAMVEQFNDLSAMRRLSDVKTVSYYLVGSTGALGASATGTASSASSFGMPTAGTNSSQTNLATLGLPPGQPQQGLGRRMVDRAATRYALENSGLSALDEQTELLAPEVTMIQFRYFDGMQWLTDWDTETFGGIPMAIEIVLALQPPTDARTDPRAPQRPSSQGTLQQFDPKDVYRLVVHLPAAEPIDTTTALDDEDTASNGSGGSGDTDDTGGSS